jgi:hypothetical protein
MREARHAGSLMRDHRGSFGRPAKAGSIEKRPAETGAEAAPWLRAEFSTADCCERRLELNMLHLGGWLIRLVAAACGLAILVSRLCTEAVDPVQHATRSERVFDGRRIGAADGLLSSKPDLQPSFLDPVTGSSFRVPFGSDHIVMHPSCSPWCDSQGLRQVVAGWMPGGCFQLAPEATGLARFTFPEAKPIDRILCEPFPIGAPAWYPNTQSRVIYAGTDGLLYHLSFEDDTQGRTNRRSTRVPQALRWNCTPPGSGKLTFRDVYWPTDPRLRDKLIVSLFYTNHDRSAEHWQLWWLRLNPEGTAIDSAGRLIVPETSAYENEGLDEAFANIADGPKRCLVLSFLTILPHRTGWQLRLAPIDMDPETGVPRVRREACVLVAEDRSSMRPEFSADRRWVFSPRTRFRQDQAVDRFSVDEILARIHTHEERPIAFVRPSPR